LLLVVSKTAKIKNSCPTFLGTFFEDYDEYQSTKIKFKKALSMSLAYLLFLMILKIAFIEAMKNDFLTDL
jgi:hypothetical protein